MKALSEVLNQSEEFQKAHEVLLKNEGPVAITGCVDSEKAHLLTNLGKDSSCRLVVTYREEKARELYEDLVFFDPNTIFFPSKDILFYSADVHSNHVASQRIRAWKELASGKPLTIVLSMDVLMERMMPAEHFKEEILEIETDSILETPALKYKLVEMGYVSNGMVEAPGEFSIRGDIIDIFPLTEDSPYRIDLWGDEVNSIRSFDVESQRSIENLESVQIYPATEMVLNRNRIQDGIRMMKGEYKKQEAVFKQAKKHKEKERLRKMVERTVDELGSLGTSSGVEFLLPYFYEKTVSFLDYLPKDTMLFIDEPHRVADKGHTFEDEFSLSMQGRLEGGYLLPSQADLMYSFEEVLGSMLTYPMTLLSTVIGKFEEYQPRNTFHIESRSIHSYNNSFEQLVTDLTKWKNENYRILLMSSSATRAKRLAKDICNLDLFAFYAENLNRELHPGQVMVTSGRLANGFSYPDLKFAILTEKDIFKERQLKKRKKSTSYKGQAIRSLADISVGDYVVHERYGLGIYRGIEKIETDGIARDFINIEYQGGGNLFVPAAQLDLIQKYSSASDHKPRLNRLDGNDWEKTKNRVRSSVKIAARDLVDLYAKRQSKKGHAFGTDTVWQKEFEELFPYEETEDQLIAISDTKKDMESTRIMDRLICGDVGFGKTEVAIRAAFKAVQDSMQVVYLVPTTILAQQHYNSFVERMQHYPVNVRMLSRFCTAKEEREIKDGLKKGTVDIVIGTHKVLSKSIQYKNLGLLIIDEEQRFGVKQKEKIKSIKTDVDVLALSATPIPRTLHMSLAGIRDMSVLEEAPVDRRSIQTYVMEYNEELVREAINRELKRGGQVFYVYNRVNNIDTIAAEVQKLVPDARVEYAHGRMGERQLEQIMFSFINKEIDVLVSTTIIETGLDISNANTMIIHDAQNFGLSQLYQLRGRVGRSNRTAYAFLMYRRNSILKEEAEKRLKAIREFTDLGSGIKIAMRDLEIRGAGNLLGAEQSGHMEAVGYDMYCKMLNDAVAELKNEKPEEDIFETSLDLNLDAYIPATYVRSENQKLDLYKRIALINDEEDKESILDELQDRYGEEVPQPLQRLLDVSMLRHVAHDAYLTAIEQKGNEIHFVFYPQAKIRLDELDAFLKSFRGKMHMKSGMIPELVYDASSVPRKELLTTVQNLIEKIRGLKEEEKEVREEDGV